MIGSLSPTLRPAVSAYTGIIRSLEECLGSVTEPSFFQAACEVAAGEWLLGTGLDHLSGLGGIGRTRAAAAAAAAGEALERYSATYVPRHTLVRASASELGEAAVAPARFGLFSERQHRQLGFRYRRFSEATRTSWVEARELPCGRPVYVPADLVFLGPVPSNDGAPVGYATSSGLACGDDVESTVERGLFELLERDAFMLVWTNRLSLPLLDGRGSEEMERDDRLFSATGLSYAAVDLSSFHGVPTVLGVVRAPRGVGGAVGVGAAAAPTIAAARWKALAEAFATRTAAAKLALLETGSARAQALGIRSFEDHIRHYAGHDAAEATAFLDGSAARTPAGSVRALGGDAAAERIPSLCQRVEAAGATAYAIDVTSPDVGELGLTVTRVLAPELCALDVASDARFLGGRRLYDAAMHAGLRPSPLRGRRRQPRPAPVSMSPANPTANFASLVYGTSGVAADDPAESFHEASRLYPNVAPSRLDVLADLDARGELSGTIARSSRIHEQRPSVELPRAVRLRGTLEDAIRRRRSQRAESSSPLRLGELATVLVSSYAAGPEREGLVRPVPSAGALYPLELYVSALAVSGLDRGVYHFHPFRRRLSLLGPLEWTMLRKAVVDSAVLDHAAALIVVTAMFWRSRFKYGQRGYRFALLEAGHIVQNVVLAAAELDVPALPLGGFYDRELDALVGADGLDEATVYAVVLGGAR